MFVLKSSFLFVMQMLNYLSCVGCSLAIMLSSEKIVILQIEIRFKSLIQIITIIFCGVWSCIIVKRKSVQSANSYVEMNQKASSNFGETEKIGANSTLYTVSSLTTSPDLTATKHLPRKHRIRVLRYMFKSSLTQSPTGLLTSVCMWQVTNGTNTQRFV